MDTQKLESFLKAVGYEEKCDCFCAEKGRDPFITISRETGAGGHSLAGAIQTELEKEAGPLFRGWQILDEKLCEMVACEPGLRVTVQNLLSSEYHSQIEDMMDEIIAGDSPQDAVIKRMFKIIRTLSTFGKVIVVGRGAAFLTQDLPLGIHIRLVASLSSRIKRMARLLKTDEKKAEEYVHAQDKARKSLVKTFFNKDIADPLHYDMIFNTDRMPIEDIARLVVAMMTKKQPVCH